MTPPFDFDALENLWIASIERALAGVSLASGDRVYGVAFSLLYAEEGAVILPPCVGVGTEASWEAVRDGEPRDAGFGSLRWNPADWRHGNLQLSDGPALDAAYDALSTHACGGADPEGMRGVDGHAPAYLAAWSAAYDRHAQALVRVCRELAGRAHRGVGPFSSLARTDDFVAVVCDPALGEEGEELLRACVDEPLFSRLFPNIFPGS